jgi:mannitol operon transcriptional antiterminator
LGGVVTLYISARERKILELLLRNKDETTVKEIADALEVSSRTVHRDLKGVEEIVKEYSLKLDKKSGSGIQITGLIDQKEKLQLFLLNLSHNEYTPEERQTIILSELLDSKEPIKLLSLANDLNVTIATISNDLNKVEERIEPFNLNLLRKRGYGVEINGSESAKRKAISNLISENIEEFEFISLIKENIQRKSLQPIDTITDRLLGLVDKKKLLIIEKQIDDIKGELPYSIADSSYIGLVVHLALAIERIQHGEEINFDKDYLDTLQHTKEFKVARRIVSGLEDIFRIQISHGEIGYITMHLMGAKLRNEHDDLLEDTSIQVGILAQNLIRYVSSEIGHDLSDNISLFQGLVAHLRPALYRIKQNMGISNPLLSGIEQDYGEMFQLLTKGVKVIFPDLVVPKEEIGYLVMHFASALLKKEELQALKMLVVCSSGIGTSKILSSKLEKEIPGIQTTNASLLDLPTINAEEYDAILSTVPLKNFRQDYLVVSPLLSTEEMSKIRRLLLDKKQFSKIVTQKDVKIVERTSSNGFLRTISTIRNYSTAIDQILSGFFICTIEEDVPIKSILQKMCGYLYEQKIIHDTKLVTHDLLEREKISGLGIPGTEMALYHTRSDGVTQPSFSLGRLNRSVAVKAMDGSNMEINTILLMLSPNDINEETIEILSGISAFMIRDEQTMNQFQSSSKNEVLELLSSELQSIYQTKVKE